MKAEVRGRFARLRYLFAGALLFFSGAGVAPSQTTENPLEFETHYRTGASGFGRARAVWVLNRFAEVRGEIEGADYARVAIAHVRLRGEGWLLDLGRQSFTLGDERLVAANRERGIAERGWDGARAEWTRGAMHVQLFGGNRGTGRLGGAAAAFALHDALTIEPYVLRSRSTLARGARAAGVAGTREYTVEIASEGAGRWAGHWDVAAPIRGTNTMFEFNYATPGFDELCPAVLNPHGTEDPFPWSDTRNVALTADRAITRTLQVNGSYRSYWNAAGAYLSQHAVLGVVYRARHWTLDAGCGRLLAVHAAEAPRWTPFLAASYRF